MDMHGTPETEEPREQSAGLVPGAGGAPLETPSIDLWSRLDSTLDRKARCSGSTSRQP